MKNDLRTILILFLFVLHYNEGRTQDSADQTVQVRIKNKSKFLISKLTILGHSFANIKSGEATGYVEVKPFYPSMHVDITVQRKPTFGKYQWHHAIIYPIDNVGETRINNEKNTILIKVLKGEEKGQIEVDTEIIED